MSCSINSVVLFYFVVAKAMIVIFIFQTVLRWIFGKNIRTCITYQTVFYSKKKNTIEIPVYNSSNGSNTVGE